MEQIKIKRTDFKSELENDMKSLQENIKNQLKKFDNKRNLFVKMYLNLILDVKDEYERLQYIVNTFSAHMGEFTGIFPKDTKYPDDYGFTCNILEVNELTDICKKCFPDHRVSWDPPGECGGEDPTIHLTKKVSEAKLNEVKKKLDNLQNEQNKVTQEVHKLQLEESRLKNLLQDCLY